MQYRVAVYSDWPALAEYINSVEYFLAVDPAQLGGQWLIAVDEEGKVRGTIWFFHQGLQSYVDYWAATSAMIGARLASLLQTVLQALGVKYVRGVIDWDNADALRLSTQGFSMITTLNPYHLVFRSF